jgi:hypothetical protein
LIPLRRRPGEGTIVTLAQLSHDRHESELTDAVLVQLSSELFHFEGELAYAVFRFLEIVRRGFFLARS